MTTAADTINDVVSGLTNWAKQPFSPDMGVGGWFAFFGFILALSLAWGIILKDLKGEL